MLENKLKNYLLLHFIVFIWGFTAILGSLISINAIALVWYRMSIATVLIFVYLLIKKRNFSTEPKAILRFIISGLIIAVHWITFFKAIKVSNVSVAMVVMSTGAFFASLIEPVFFKRKLQVVEILLGLTVIFGLYIIFSFESKYSLGIIYALISAFLSALFSVLNGLYIKKHPAVIISFYQLLFGAAGVSIFLILTKQISITFFYLSISDWIYILILSSICTAYAFIASVKVMKYITPYTVMLTINLEPVYAIVLALIVFGRKEQMHTQFYFGALVVLFVVLLNGIVKKRQKIKSKNK